MNNQLKNAIIQFIADEYQLEPENIDSDMDLRADLNLDPVQMMDLLQRIQESLNFILPDEKINDITTINDIFEALTEENDEPGRSNPA